MKISAQNRLPLIRADWGAFDVTEANLYLLELRGEIQMSNKQKEYQKRRNISLSDDYAEKAKEIGGNVSEGIRVAIDRFIDFESVLAETREDCEYLAIWCRLEDAGLINDDRE